MAYTAGNLHLRPGAVGNEQYTYNATTTGASDTLAEILVAGYFNNTDDNLNLAVDDMIYCRCTDGYMNVVVSAVSSGSVTCQFAGGNLPIQTVATGTAVTLGAVMEVGNYDIGTSISTSTRNALRVPYPGAEINVRKVDSGTRVFHFDAGNSATAATGTSVVYDAAGNRRFLLRYQGEGFHVVGTSASRWRVMNMYSVSTHGSGTLGYGASLFLIGT